MTYFQDLNTASEVMGNDYFPIFRGSSKKALVSDLLEYVQANIETTDSTEPQYSAPSSTGFTASIGGSGESVWLVLTPSSTLAAGTIKLPEVSTCVSKQEVLVSCSQIVTTLTIDGNGGGVVGAPTTLSAGGFFRLRFEPVLKIWYRVG